MPWRYPVLALSDPSLMGLRPREGRRRPDAEAAIEGLKGLTSLEK